MLYGQTRLLFPQKRHVADPTMAAGGVDLAGVAFDQETGHVVTYAQSSGKLYWLVVSSGDVVQSAFAPLPLGSKLVDMCQFANVLYLLVYTGDGHLSICVGSLQQGRDTGHMTFEEYPVPYLVPATGNVWLSTHAPFPEYLRYHPHYCSIANCGHQLFLLIGVSDDVESVAPPNLGQYLVHYDLSGLFTAATLLDASTPPNPFASPPTPAMRPPTLANVYNGLGMAIAYREGGLTLMAENFQHDVGATKESRLFSESVQTPPERTTKFITGPFGIGTSLHLSARHHFFIANGRLYQAGISPFSIGATDALGLYRDTIDMGIVPHGGVVEKHVTLTNLNYQVTYKNIWIETTNVHTQVGRSGTDPLNPSAPPEHYQDRLHWEWHVAPGETIDFWVRIFGPTIANNRIPNHYFDYLTLRAEGVW